MNLVIDIGNTRSKIAVFKEDSMLESRVLVNAVSDSIRDLKDQFTDINHCIIATVKSELQDIPDALEKLDISYKVLTPSLKFPFRIQYHTPETLGNDRLAAVAGAFAIHPNKDILIIDAGTAITFDLITIKDGYLGGVISPGLEMRYKALHSFTDKLPLQVKQEDHELLGQSTSEAITGGVQNGLIFEIEGYLTKIGEKYPQLTVLLTGGDAQFFDNKLKKTIFVIPNLTLVGLNFILNYNAQAK
jgi:type III pantothenate kinase